MLLASYVPYKTVLRERLEIFSAPLRGQSQYRLGNVCMQRPVRDR